MDSIQTTGGVYTKEIEKSILHNISTVFSCEIDEIENLVPVQAGMTNIVLSFEYNGGKYIYRHPGLGSEALVDRSRETLMQAVVAEAGIDTTLVAMDVEKGWKIARYIKHRDFDYTNLNDMVRAVMLFQVLHKVPSKVRYNFDVIEKAEQVKAQIEPEKYGGFEHFEEIRDNSYKLHKLAEKDGIHKCYVHGDARDVNFLINKEEIYLIDWEYGGYGDPGFDIGSYINGGEHTQEEVDRILFTYFGRTPTRKQKRHFYAYIALTGWFYMHWTMLKWAKGQDVPEIHPRLWSGYALNYGRMALKMYEEDNDI